jgi:hypothetical protein
MVARKAIRSRRSEPLLGSDTQSKSAHRVCGGSPQNQLGYLVEPQNQDRRLSGRRRDPSAREDSKKRTYVGITRLASRLREGQSPGIRPMVLQNHIPKLPLVGVYPSFGFRGILVIRIRLSPYILRGERMAALSRNPSSFGFPIFLPIFPRISIGLA